MKKLKAGVIGLGVGQQHMEGYDSHPCCEVVAVCDFCVEKCRQATQRYPGIKVYGDCDALLSDEGIDVVSVASYDNYHYEQIVGAIENDKHVFAEKPFCLYPKEAEHIRSLLREKPNLKMSSNLVLRRSLRFLGLKELIDAGRLGRIYYVEGDYNYGRIHKITEGWRGEIDYYSVVYGGGVHVVDLLLWLTGQRVREVSAYGNNISTRGTQFKYNDVVTGILKFDNGMTGKVACNYSCVFPHFHNFTVYGTEATYVNDFEYGKLYRSRDPQAGFERVGDSYGSVHKGELIHDFLDSILGDAEPEITVDEIFDSMSVCFAIEKSADGNGAVEVDYI